MKNILHSTRREQLEELTTSLDMQYAEQQSSSFMKQSFGARGGEGRETHIESEENE